MKRINHASSSIFITISIILTSLMVFSFGCVKKEEKEIKIGVMLALTGDSANYGNRSLHGILWALEKINRNGGINNKKIKLIVEDTKSNPKDAVNAFNKLMTIDKVAIVIGDIISGTTLSVAPVAEKNKILLFAPGASNPALRNAGDYIFRNWTSDDFDGKAMAQYLIKKGIKEIALLVQKTDYTIGLADALINEFKKNGGIISTKEEFETDSADLRTQLTKLKDKKAQYIYVSSYSHGTGLALRQAKELGMKAQWFASLTVDTPECEKIAGVARNGVIFTTPAFNKDDTRVEMKQFVEGFKEKFNDEPETVAGHAYDALNILALAMKRVGFDHKKIKDELYKTKDFPGVTGITSFDDEGDVIKGIYIKQFKGNSPILLEEFMP